MAAPSARPPAAKPLLPLTTDIIVSIASPVTKLMEQQSFKPARVFSDAVDNSSSGESKNPLQVTSLSFDDAGERCVTSGEDDVFTVYDARKGK